MTQKEADKLAWKTIENLFKDIPNVELVPSERTKRELLDDDNGEKKQYDNIRQD